MVESYVDESYDSESEDPLILSLGGHVSTAENAKALSAEWSAILHRHEIPLFRMSLCNSLNGRFRELGPELSDQIARQLIDLCLKYSSHSYAVLVRETDYEEILPKILKDEFGSPYAFLVARCMTVVSKWAKEHDIEGDAAYFFESGHRNEPDAIRVLDGYKKDSIIESRLRIGTYTFADKRKVVPLQAADIIAWQWRKQIERKADGKPVRGDLKALTRPGDRLLHFTRTVLAQLVIELYQRQVSRDALSRS